jgi:phosphopantothenoylcysteine decarboxylase/phosphopantothenate--cysteine ligase
MFGNDDDCMPHISLARNTDLVVIAPATADFIARAAAGRADDLLSCLLLVTQSPVVVAPAMNPSMWAHPLTQRNVRRLTEDSDVQWVGPDRGDAACGEQGAGRLASPETIVAALSRAYQADLAGQDIVITAGATREPIDPVRYLSNRSSGKMGYALAACAQRRAASVTLISGPVALPPPPGVEFVPVTTAAEMHRAVTEHSAGADALIMAAAVADYRPAQPSEQKIHRQADSLSLELLPNADILASIGNGRQGPRPVVVGFALETDQLLESAQAKLHRKGCDLLVANLAADALGGDRTVAHVLDAQGVVDSPGPLAKTELADRILDHVVTQLDRTANKP